MYDELIKRLRSATTLPVMNAMCQEAADAIEELSKPQLDSRDGEVTTFEGAVLCMRKSNVYGVRQYQEILYVDEYGFKNFDDIYLADGVVTHWMPLPEPPKED